MLHTYVLQLNLGKAREIERKQYQIFQYLQLFILISSLLSGSLGRGLLVHLGGLLGLFLRYLLLLRRRRRGRLGHRLHHLGLCGQDFQVSLSSLLCVMQIRFKIKSLSRKCNQPVQICKPWPERHRRPRRRDQCRSLTPSRRRERNRRSALHIERSKLLERKSLLCYER